MNIKIDSEFGALIPPLLPDEFAQLESNIIRDGCHEPLTLWGEVLIDGHNRHKICTKHNVRFTTRILSFDDRENVKIWIGERQLGRRNLTDDQRAIIANDVREIRAKINRVEQTKHAIAERWNEPYVEGTFSSTYPTLKERARIAVAKEAGISETKLRYAQETKKTAPEVIPFIRSGSMSLLDGKRIAALPASARSIALEAVKSGDDVRTAVRAAKKEDYNARIESIAPKALEGTYRIFYADPPWKYARNHDRRKGADRPS